MSDTSVEAKEEIKGDAHPISTYFWVWGLLFVLSALSYMVDYMQFQGMVRWTLIIIFMLLKAGFITAIFMHLYYERLAMACAILIPTGALMVLLALMNFEGNHTNEIRATYLDGASGILQMEEGHGH